MADDLVLYLDSNNVIRLQGLQNTSDDSYVNDASVTCTVYECNRITEVQSVQEAWPVVLSYVPASNGDYEATLADDLVGTEEDQYFAKVTATTTGGNKKVWWMPIRMEYDDGD